MECHWEVNWSGTASTARGPRCSRHHMPMSSAISNRALCSLLPAWTSVSSLEFRGSPGRRSLSVAARRMQARRQPNSGSMLASRRLSSGHWAKYVEGDRWRWRSRRRGQRNGYLRCHRRGWRNGADRWWSTRHGNGRGWRQRRRLGQQVSVIARGVLSVHELGELLDRGHDGRGEDDGGVLVDTDLEQGLQVSQLKCERVRHHHVGGLA